MKTLCALWLSCFSLLNLAAQKQTGSILEIGIEPAVYQFGKTHVTYNNRYQFFRGIMVRYYRRNNSAYRFQAVWQRDVYRDYFTGKPIPQAFNNGFLTAVGYQVSARQFWGLYLFGDVCYQHLWYEQALGIGTPPVPMTVKTQTSVLSIRPGIGTTLLRWRARWSLTLEVCPSFSFYESNRHFPQFVLSNYTVTKLQGKFAGGVVRLTLLRQVSKPKPIEPSMPPVKI